MCNYMSCLAIQAHIHLDDVGYRSKDFMNNEENDFCDSKVTDSFFVFVFYCSGLLARSVIQAQAASPTFTHVYAALVAIINTKVCFLDLKKAVIICWCCLKQMFQFHLPWY